MSDVEDESVPIEFGEAKNLKNISIHRFPCAIECKDGTKVDTETWFDPTMRENGKTKTALLRGRPLEGTPLTDLNMFLVKPDSAHEGSLKATAKVDELINWQVQPVIDDKFDTFMRVMPQLLSVLHD